MTEYDGVWRSMMEYDGDASIREISKINYHTINPHLKAELTGGHV